MKEFLPKWKLRSWMSSLDRWKVCCWNKSWIGERILG